MSREVRFAVGKLIRDKLPDILRSKDITVFEHKMDEQEYIAKLKGKLIAKTDAIVQENRDDDFLEELDDILEVIYALGINKNYTHQDIENQRKKIEHEKGRFNNRIYNRYITMKENNPAVEYYRSNRSKYSEFDKNFNLILVNERLRINKKQTFESSREI